MINSASNEMQRSAEQNLLKLACRLVCEKYLTIMYFEWLSGMWTHG